jgi:IclR family transcriptional regulator, acetate operon repressor
VESDTDAPESYGPPPKYPIESVDNALRLLSLFRSQERIRVKDASETLGVATGTAHRLLSMLVYRGYVAKDPVTKVYVPGLMLLQIGLQAAQRSDLRAAAGQYLDQLRADLDETIQLATLERRDVFFVDARESSKALRVTSRAGSLRPAHCTSVGKALLAELPREAILELYPSEDLDKVTEASIGTRSQLLLELEATRARGYGINFGELEDGIGSVASVVRRHDGHVVAAIGAGAPLSRIDDLRLQEMAEAVIAATKRLGDDLN